MKSLTYITLIAAIVFGMNVPQANAATINDNITLEELSGRVSAHYDKTTQVLILRMAAATRQDRVIIALSGRGGDVVYKEKTVVDTRGTVVEIPMSDLDSGNYFLRVKGSQISYSLRIRHK